MRTPFGRWEQDIHHRCSVPDQAEIRVAQAGQGSKWICHTCGDRWRLVFDVGRASWLNLNTEDKRWVGEV